MEEAEETEEGEEAVAAPKADPVKPEDTPTTAPALMVAADAKLSPMDILRLAAKQEKQRRAYAAPSVKLPSVVKLANGIVIRNN